ncbi:MAG: DoxX family membrane protein [Sphingobacteriaceae bacterium]|nr:MAG: DoxX family membrane protein [Sphingobacteriaceae bacterium]
MSNLKKVSLILLILLYVVAGINHFRSAAAYISIIPPYFPFPKLLNILAGCFELLFGLMLIFKKTRTYAVYGIIFLLIIFTTVHIYMIQLTPFKLGSFTVSKTVAWIRLPLQLVLIAWAYWHRKD